MICEIPSRSKWLGPLLLLSFFSFVLGLCSCSHGTSSKRGGERSRLEKQIFKLEDQISSQKDKIRNLEGQLSKPLASVSRRRSPKPYRDVFSEETVVDSIDENMHLYYEGLKFREQGDWEKAARAFNEFVVTNPDHVYVDRAQYLLMTSHFQAGEYVLTLADAQLFENRFGDSRKLPEVLYYSALSYVRLGEREKGTQTLKTLLVSFPQSAIVASAEKDLQDLKTQENLP